MLEMFKKKLLEKQGQCLPGSKPIPEEEPEPKTNCELYPKGRYMDNLVIKGSDNENYFDDKVAGVDYCPDTGNIFGRINDQMPNQNVYSYAKVLVNGNQVSDGQLTSAKSLTDIPRARFNPTTSGDNIQITLYNPEIEEIEEIQEPVIAVEPAKPEDKLLRTYSDLGELSFNAEFNANGECSLDNIKIGTENVSANTGLVAILRNLDRHFHHTERSTTDKVWNYLSGSDNNNVFKSFKLLWGNWR